MSELGQSLVYLNRNAATIAAKCKGHLPGCRPASHFVSERPLGQHDGGNAFFQTNVNLCSGARVAVRKNAPFNRCFAHFSRAL
jgi:hypothetical protein